MHAYESSVNVFGYLRQCMYVCCTLCVCVCDLMSACVQRVNECVCPCLHVPVCLLMLVCVNVCSCSSAGRTVVPGGPGVDQVRVKQEPGTKEDYGCTASNSSSSNSSVRSARWDVVGIQTTFKRHRRWDRSLYLVCVWGVDA
jgi:hypothetical protein